MAKERMFDFCTSCRKETAYKLCKKTVQKVIKDKVYEFEITIAVCDECGNEMDIPGILDTNVKAIDEQYRQAEKLISIDDIKKLMNIYNIGKAPLSIALGFGEITITRYLSGQIPSREYSDVIKKALSSPNYMIQLMNENMEKMGETAYKKAIKAAEEVANLFCVSDKMLLTISYIFEQMKEITPLALQKILYFIQGIYMVMFGEPLYKEDCMAWIHGPVYRCIYDRYKCFGRGQIEINDSDEILLDEIEDYIVGCVVRYFGCYSGKILEEMTHSEMPWILTRRGLKKDVGCNRIIEKEFIDTYFKNVKDKYKLISIDDIKEYSTTLFNSIN